MALKGNNHNRLILATAIFLVVFMIAVFNSISVTSFSISDSDPSGYIIVPMLMLLVFIVFSIKEKLIIEYKPRNIAYGAILAVFYFVVYAYSKVSLSFIFETYRIDALLFPIILSAFAVMLFGTYGLNKLKPAIIFSIFASPLILMPILNLSGAWTSFNAYTVFTVLKTIGIPVLRNGIIISGASGSQISIASTCADIAAFVAMALFLIPIAYVYYGNLKKKLLWFLSGILLLFVLNIIRMTSIAVVWAYYGISAALNTVHLFIGQLLFDVVLIIMIIIAPKFGMYLRQSKSTKGAASSSKRPAIVEKNTYTKLPSAYIPIISSFVLAFLIFGFTIPLNGYSYISPFEFLPNTGSISNTSIISSYDSLAANSGYSMRSSAFAGRAELFGVYKTNDINTTTNDFLFINTTIGPSLPKINKASLGTIYSHRQAATASGITVNAYVVNASGKLFQINYLSIPNRIFGNYTTANLEYISLLNSTSLAQSCGNVSELSGISQIYSYIYNALHGSFSADNYSIACISENMLGRR